MLKKKTHFYKFNKKIKKVKKALSTKRRDTFGNIFEELIIRDKIVKIKENIFEEQPNAINREVLHQAQAKFKRYLYFEKEFWSQKASLN